MRVEPDKMDAQTIAVKRKKAIKTALILGAVAVGFFSWAIYIVIKHASL